MPGPYVPPGALFIDPLVTAAVVTEWRESSEGPIADLRDRIEDGVGALDMGEVRGAGPAGRLLHWGRRHVVPPDGTRHGGALRD